MLYIWPLILCLLTLLCLDVHSMPFDFGDPMSIDFAKALKDVEMRKIADAKNLNNEKEEFETTSHPLYHYKRHHKHTRHHRRSLKTPHNEVATEKTNGEKRIVSPEFHVHKRSKHLMLTKPYWPWP